MHTITRTVLALLARATLFSAMLIGSAAVAQAAAPLPLTLINGWTNAPFSTHPAAVKITSNIVYFQGAIATTGTNAEPFVLPAGYRPLVNVFIPIDLCNATKGRLYITPSGDVIVQAEGGTFSNAQCFTSLDGASFPLVATGFKPVTLLNGWTGAPFGTGAPTVKKVGSVIQFKGAVASGTSAELFALPAADRPPTYVYVPIDLCNAANGRLIIAPTGEVDVEAQNAFSDAQCFSSLDGASFALNATGFTALPLLNGWTNAPFSTRDAAAKKIGGFVHFEGAIATGGTNSVPFVLPKALSPKKDVYVPVDLCDATNGRLHITPNGTVDVEVEGGMFSNAQCFTSLEGALFLP
jgi:hypothetical protein